MASPNAGFPEMPANTFQPSVTFNKLVQMLDAFYPLVFQSMSLTAPPGTVSGDVGKRWVPAAPATGAWAGHEGEIALCSAAGEWVFLDPPNYIEGLNLIDSLKYRNVSGTWTVLP